MNADWTSAGNESRKKKRKRKPHHSCVIQLPPRTFILLGIYSYVHDEFNLWGNVRDSDGTRAMLLWREDTAVEGSQAAGGSGWKSFSSRWCKGLGQRKGPRRLRGAWAQRSKKAVASREVSGVRETETTEQRSSGKERRPVDVTARDAAIFRCLF